MLIKCPECGNEVSDKAKTCPHCGYTLLEDISEEETKVEDTTTTTNTSDSYNNNSDVGGDIAKGLIGAAIINSLFRPRRRRRPMPPFGGPGPGPGGPHGGRGRRF